MAPGGGRNDYDCITEAVRAALSALLSATHMPSPTDGGDNSVTVVKDGWITVVVRLQRLVDWTQGLVDQHAGER